jgi:hypothetical protein
LQDETIEVLDGDGLPLRPRLRLAQAIVRHLLRADLVRGPRHGDFVSVRIRTGVTIGAVYLAMRRSQPRDRIPVALDSRTVRDGIAGPEHRFHANDEHPFSQASGYGSGWDEPRAEGGRAGRRDGQRRRFYV